MNRKTLSEDSGMLFIFEEEKINSFWMKNTLIALDIIWIDKDNKIVFIKKDAQPCIEYPCETFVSSIPSKYVLEISAGLSENLNIHEGDKIKFYLN